MAAGRKVLGNNPFERGAAVRRPPVPPAEAAPVTPAAAETTAAPGPVEHAASPVLAPDVAARAHAPAPPADVVDVAEGPAVVADVVADARAPSPPADAVPHQGAPTVEAGVGHADSPGPSVEVTPHPASPTAGAVEPNPPEAAPRQAGLWQSLLDALGGSPDAHGRDEAWVRQLRPLVELLTSTYWQLEARADGGLPEGPAIYVANHSGALPLDGPIVHLALRRLQPGLPPPRWLLEEPLLATPGLGPLTVRLGAVQATPEAALELLREGASVIVFPEGQAGLGKTREQRHLLRRFGRGGYLKLALKAGVPVVPVAVSGGEASLPLLARLPGAAWLPLTVPLPTTWTVRFGAPLRLDGAPPGAARDGGWIQQHNDAVRDAVAAMLRGA